MWNFIFENTYGLLDLSFWGYVIFTVLAMQVTLASVTLYLHRDQAHQSIVLHSAIRVFCRIWLWLTTAMLTREWVAVHRKHHAMCERKGDPHSPVIFGLKKVLLEGAELYQIEAANEETVAKYSRGCPDDGLERFMERFENLGLQLLFVAYILLLGIPGIIVYAIQMLTIPVLAAGVINGLGHAKGYRNFECDDAATNLTPLAIIVAGEELHNNHHAFPTSAKFSVQWWEFDIGWMYISMLKPLGLVTVKRVAPKPRLAAAPRQVDIETLQAVLMNRMNVLRTYTRSVTLPILKSERASVEQGFMPKAKKLLVSNPILLDNFSQDHLRELLDANQTLKTVHEYRERLMSLWDQANITNENLVAQLKEWCVEAESSGVQVLEDFSQNLREYILTPQMSSA
ncbi:MAG: fatty acid desaturase [Gammaproteobacteria bacterium]|nr:fatty acid desaturase [Gammaproteobacteria bacterium]